MSETSPGLAVAWRIAATEAGAAGYAKIECPHLLMGLLSLDKANLKVLKDLGFSAGQIGQVGGEQAAIADLFESAGVSTRVLRRDLRSRVKRKSSRSKGMMSRSTVAKAAFARAETLSAGNASNSLHLLSVLLRDPDPVISSLLVAHGLGPDLADRVEAAAARSIRSVAARREPTTDRSPREGLAPVADQRLLKLEAHLKSKLIGQDEAVATVAARIKLAHAGRSERQRPLAVFIFLGPPDVGKTEMALTLAKFLFGEADDLLHFDMSEYPPDQSASRLVEAILRKPQAVLLLDHVDKAHPGVFDLLVRLLDTGKLTDSSGRVADARSTIVIMTSTLGNTLAKPGSDAGAQTLPVTRTGRTKADLRRFFRPEFLNHVDDIITFRALDEADVRRITRPLLGALITNVRKTHGVLLRFEPDAEALVIRAGLGPQKGVGELKAAIERLVAMPLATLAVSGKLAQHPAWKAVHDDGGLYFLPE